MSSPIDGLDLTLVTVIRDNQEKVVGWIRQEPGSWGFLAGKAVRACRETKGEPLTDTERRIVWHRMWQLLTELKEQTVK